MNSQDDKRLRIGTIFLIFIIFIIVGYANWPETYGNDVPSVEKVISRQESIRSKVSVFKTEEIHHYKIAGFLDKNGDVGVAFFRANEKGNYVFLGLDESSTRNGIQVSYLDFEDADSETAGVDIISSSNSRLSQIRRVIRGTDVSTADIAVNPSLTLMEIPDRYRDSYNTSFIFYDVNGMVIEP